MTTLFPTYIDDKALAQDLILSQFDNFLIDCDGVIWLSEQLLPKINQFYNFLLRIIKSLHLSRITHPSLVNLM